MGLPEVLDRIERACRRAGRDPRGVRLVAVTKGHTVPEIRDRVLRYGAFALGESRIQEALPKLAELAAEWHYIGPLQRNKAKFAVRFELVHSVDSLRLAETLARKAREVGKVQRVLLELNLGREPQKHGFLEEELPEALAQVRELEGLRLEGLMTVAPYTENPEEVRPIFARLSRLADTFGLAERSMGMSGDFEVAVEEGATLVRVGRALFEPGAGV
ncbi:MAG: YggS family pyridoxal phosphate-dependent enzyme [Meiothermus sp.]|uniref:YggS family pyridoxal phosphate-dependent enzyme n=1 Tax=Meiothermus sp. TaxID=1955249 RepID=UPI0025E773A9|nr:YggS family pyridoxal phosphate-dependent enzyme [Meiothermus sp.]MCS7057954.1 YggS family pyridoxal phosphate-dependent enzyme [Meiothermus sp.]MCS7193680.1 YggS family pyridoxal phosphate-dependent enzyme [Meiothermus sp.]MCX7740068.1 YggS family pyridoxal phosphate-dependent enzyme [Meiothermus sp.]MDW8091318.1 YggS family pyridoxal phosphate-dependent enzyme [Meiothermus sp.]MDW8481612.1 YggS family pyridoxal phosphate-dependent enzyme [Meiothermus sp.]